MFTKSLYPAPCQHWAKWGSGNSWHYGNQDNFRHQQIEENFQRCQTLEHHLFSHINFAASELADKVATDKTPHDLNLATQE